ncbi:NADH-cytochrome b5 reductase-like [Epargyreus clarus]|uniref:NADH-cytochrome b5 reductase-like n=1 Tax=Epargyreus clarus TaxID=520877 RepID=UPI003C2F10BD
MVDTMEPPKEPSLEDCCHSGCNPCIFDVYERQLKLYRQNGNKSASQELRKENGISELNYTEFIIVSVILLSKSQKILKFKRANKNSPQVWWTPGHHFLFKYNSEKLSCSRAYTPVKLSSHKKEDYDFAIAIKRYENGVVSNYLFKLEEGDLTLWRGPYGIYKIASNKFNRIVMVAQGTGIAPFINIIESILNDEDDMTKIILYYCCRSIDEILFRDELYLYRSYWNFSYSIFLTHIPSNAIFRYEEPIIMRKFSYEYLNKIKPYLNDQVLLCGSSEFMQTYSDALKREEMLENVILF